MCTAIAYRGFDFYFGRNLDFEHSFGEKIIITARDFPIKLRHVESFYSHYAIIGMGIVSENFPLYFDGANEKGLSIAGLLFPHFCVYHQPMENMVNISSFEFVPYILSRCESVSEARRILKEINITDTPFGKALPPTPLHWIIADKNDCIAVESVKEGLSVYDNPAKVLTNAPPFPSQLHNLSNFTGLSPYPPQSDFPQYSRGLGTIGLPGDFSSQSRFVRAAYVREHSPSLKGEQECVNQFFHILESVYAPRGSIVSSDGNFFTTHYSSCINADRGIYYYKTYDNPSLSAVCLADYELDRDMLYTFALDQSWHVNYQRG